MAAPFESFALSAASETIVGASISGTALLTIWLPLPSSISAETDAIPAGRLGAEGIATESSDAVAEVGWSSTGAASAGALTRTPMTAPRFRPSSVTASPGLAAGCEPGAATICSIGPSDATATGPRSPVPRANTGIGATTARFESISTTAAS